MTLVGADHHDRDRSFAEARLETWRGMSDESRLTYTWPDPGLPREPLSPFPTQAPDPLDPLPHFCLLVLEVSRSIISSSTGIPSTAGGTLEIRTDAGREPEVNPWIARSRRASSRTPRSLPAPTCGILLSGAATDAHAADDLRHRRSPGRRRRAW